MVRKSIFETILRESINETKFLFFFLSKFNIHYDMFQSTWSSSGSKKYKQNAWGGDQQYKIV